MSVTIACPFCKTPLRTPDTGAGRAIRCPRCGYAIRLPAAAGTTPATGGTPHSGTPPRR
jgi:hypothetical protein